MSQAPREDHQDEQKKYSLNDVKLALSPFEDRLLTRLPSKEDILRRAKQRQYKKKISYTAFAFVALLTGGLYSLDPVYQSQQWQTQLGESQQIELLDRSTVHLNSNSKITVDYHLFSKRIQLEQGEAIFTVDHSDWKYLAFFERRFIVNSGILQVEDIGTVFNVRHYAVDHNRVGVLQGSVKARLNTGSNQPQLILKEQDFYEHKGDQLYRLKQNTLNAETAWQYGYVVFDHTPLKQAIAAFKPYQDFEVSFVDPETENILISGRFQLRNHTAFMQILPQLIEVKTLQESKQHWLIMQNQQ